MVESDAPTSPDDALVVNGIDGATGLPAFPPATVADVAAHARAELADPWDVGGVCSDESRDETDLATGGWAVVVPKGLDPAVRRAVDALCVRRARQAGRRYVELDFNPATEDFRSWLARYQVSPGNVDHDCVPRYLLLLGPPTLIPFEVQYLLGIDYGVGRLAFDTPAEYAAYAASVIAYETAAAPATAREACFWGPRQDAATELSSTDLLAPLVDGWGRSEGLGDEAGYRTVKLLAADAGKDGLLSALHRPASPPPTLLFTASHGAVWAPGDARQPGEQGALLSQDWSTGEPVLPAHCVAAADVDDKARIHGLVAFLFACFGAATPQVDGFTSTRAGPPRTLAPAPFVSALPRRLLAHPAGGALGVFSHVDRAWGCSIRRAGQTPQIGPFREGLLRLLRGAPLGDVLSDFARRYAVLSASLLASLDRGASPLPDAELAARWLERSDAQGYVLLGDPGASVRKDVA